MSASASREMPLKPSPKISVVIPTYTRAQVLRETLACLRRQVLDPALMEVVVSDDGSKDDTEAIVAEATSLSPFPIIYERHDNHGVGYTENRGVECASGWIVLIIADDIWLEPQAVASHLAAHEAAPAEGVAFLGRVDRSPRLDQSPFLRNWNQHRFETLKDGTRLPYYRFWACNVSAKRSFLVRGGLFREQLGVGGYAAHEDSELGYRLQHLGLDLRYLGSARGYHYHVTALQDELRRSFGRGVNFAAEFSKLVPTPEIAVAYRVFDFRSHWRALTGPGREHLFPSDRNPLILSFRYTLRLVLFNRLLVETFWLPLMRAADRSPSLARRMRPIFYRGVIHHYFLRGCRSVREQSRASLAQPDQSTRKDVAPKKIESAS